MTYLVDKCFIVVLQLCSLSIEAVQLFLQSHQGSFHGTLLLCQRLAAPHVHHFPGLSQCHGCAATVCVAASTDVGSTYTLGESCQAMDSNVFCNCKAFIETVQIFVAVQMVPTSTRRCPAPHPIKK